MCNEFENDPFYIDEEENEREWAYADFLHDAMMEEEAIREMEESEENV